MNNQIKNKIREQYGSKLNEDSIQQNSLHIDQKQKQNFNATSEFTKDTKIYKLNMDLNQQIRNNSQLLDAKTSKEHTIFRNKIGKNSPLLSLVNDGSIFSDSDYIFSARQNIEASSNFPFKVESLKIHQNRAKSKKEKKKIIINPNADIQQEIENTKVKNLDQNSLNRGSQVNFQGDTNFVSKSLLDDNVDPNENKIYYYQKEFLNQSGQYIIENNQNFQYGAETQRIQQPIEFDQTLKTNKQSITQKPIQIRGSSLQPNKKESIKIVSHETKQNKLKQTKENLKEQYQALIQQKVQNQEFSKHFLFQNTQQYSQNESSLSKNLKNQPNIYQNNLMNSMNKAQQSLKVQEIQNRKLLNQLQNQDVLIENQLLIKKAIFNQNKKSKNDEYQNKNTQEEIQKRDQQTPIQLNYQQLNQSAKSAQQYLPQIDNDNSQKDDTQHDGSDTLFLQKSLGKNTIIPGLIEYHEDQNQFLQYAPFEMQRGSKQETTNVQQILQIQGQKNINIKKLKMKSEYFSRLQTVDEHDQKGGSRSTIIFQEGNEKQIPQQPNHNEIKQLDEKSKNKNSRYQLAASPSFDRSSHMPASKISEFSKKSKYQKKEIKKIEVKESEQQKTQRFHSRGNGARDLSSDKNDSLNTQNEIDLQNQLSSQIQLQGLYPSFNPYKSINNQTISYPGKTNMKVKIQQKIKEAHLNQPVNEKEIPTQENNLKNKAVFRRALLQKQSILMRKYQQKAGVMKSINDYCSLQKQENKLTKENLKDLLTSPDSFWQSQQKFEDNYSVMKLNTNDENNTDLEEQIYDIYMQSLQTPPNVSFNQQLIDNYKFFGARKHMLKAKNNRNIVISDNNDIIANQDSIYSDLSVLENFRRTPMILENIDHKDDFSFLANSPFTPQQFNIYNQAKTCQSKQSVRNNNINKHLMMKLRFQLKTENMPFRNINNTSGMQSNSEVASIIQDGLHTSYNQFQRGITPATAKDFTNIRQILQNRSKDTSKMNKNKISLNINIRDQNNISLQSSSRSPRQNNIKLDEYYKFIANQNQIFSKKQPIFSKFPISQLNRTSQERSQILQLKQSQTLSQYDSLIQNKDALDKYSNIKLSQRNKTLGQKVENMNQDKRDTMRLSSREKISITEQQSPRTIDSKMENIEDQNYESLQELSQKDPAAFLRLSTIKMLQKKNQNIGNDNLVNDNEQKNVIFENFHIGRINSSFQEQKKDRKVKFQQTPIDNLIQSLIINNEFKNQEKIKIFQEQVSLHSPDKFQWQKENQISKKQTDQIILNEIQNMSKTSNQHFYENLHKQIQMPGGFSQQLDLSLYNPPKTYFSGNNTKPKNNHALMQVQKQFKRKYNLAKLQKLNDQKQITESEEKEQIEQTILPKVSNTLEQVLSEQDNKKKRTTILKELRMYNSSKGDNSSVEESNVKVLLNKNAQSSKLYMNQQNFHDLNSILNMSQDSKEQRFDETINLINKQEQSIKKTKDHQEDIQLKIIKKKMEDEMYIQQQMLYLQEIVQRKKNSITVYDLQSQIDKSVFSQDSKKVNLANNKNKSIQFAI